MSLGTGETCEGTEGDNKPREMRREDAEGLTLSRRVSGWRVTAGCGTGRDLPPPETEPPGRRQVHRCWMSRAAGNEESVAKHATVYTRVRQ